MSTRIEGGNDKMFIEGQNVRYIKTNEQVTIEDVNNDSNGEWYFILTVDGDCFPVDASELVSL